MAHERLVRQLQRAIERGDRVASVLLAQRLWHAGDLRRLAVVTMHLPYQPVAEALGLRA